MTPLPEIPYDEWFDGNKPHPHDSMPIAKDEGSAYSSRHESTPDFEKSAEEVVSIHEKMYRMATEKGGSWLGGGSEEVLPPRAEEEVYDTFNDPYGGA